MQREQSLTTAETRLILPEWYQGMQHWDAPEVAEIVGKLNGGDPALGWEGDPRLALYHEGDHWMLYRLEHDGSLRPILRSRPGVRLDQGLIIKLMEHDQWRGFDPLKVLEDLPG